MKQPAEHDPLLDDVLSEDAPPGYRSHLLQATLRQARRRRQFKRGRQVLLSIVVMGLMGVWVSRQMPRPESKPESLAMQPEFPLVVVRTQPLPASALVSTAPLSTDVIVATTGGQYRIIDDDELLALAAPAPVALIRCGPDCAQLVFANAEDRARLLVP